MGTTPRKKHRPRRTFSSEFKSEIVEYCNRGDRSIRQVAKDFDLHESDVRAWVEQAKTDAGTKPGLTTEEKAELKSLRQENRRLRLDNDTLKRAAVFFARETQ